MNELLAYFGESLRRNTHVKSFNIIGSASMLERLIPNSEVDVHVVLDRCTPKSLSEIIGVAARARQVIGRAPFVETRRGPFCIQDSFQIHLIVDDLRSVTLTSAITLADWYRTSRLVVGTPIVNYIQKPRLAASFSGEFNKTLQMLRYREIIYKQWVTIGNICELSEYRRPVRTRAEYCELLKYAYKAMTSDLAALLDLKKNEAPADRWLSEQVAIYKKPSCYIRRVSDWATRVLQWNRELERIAQTRWLQST